MALGTGIQGVFAPVNVAGALFVKTDTTTPLFNRLGGVAHGSREFIVGSDYELAASSATAQISEDASVTAPAPSYDSPVQVKNVTEIHMKAVRSTYRKISNVDALTGLNLAGQENNVKNPLALAIRNRLAELRNDLENTIINSEYNLATTSAEVDRTRGLNEAIVTNVIEAAGAELNPDILMEVARAFAGTPFGLNGVLGVLNAEQIVQLNKIITDEGHRASMGDAGSNLLTYLTPFGRMTFLEGGHRFQTNGTAGFYRLGVCRNVLHPVPGMGSVFYEPLAKTGATEHGQIYAQWGLDHGLEWQHAKVTGLATTTGASTAPKVHIENTADAPVYTSAVSA
jgi:hypothetical protein